MRALSKWSLNNRVAVNMIMIFIIIGGLFILSKMKREVFPQFSLDMIYISVLYPGASPEEVEDGICIKIEEQIKGIENIARILSTSDENYGSVIAELKAGSDISSIMEEIKTEVDSITFPKEAEKPVVLEIVNRMPVINVAVYGDISEKRLTNIAERIKEDILDTAQVSLAELAGVRDYEISVEVSEKNLRRYGISFDHVVNAIKTASVDLPGGSVKTTAGEILVHSKGQLFTSAEFETIPLITSKDGTVIRLGDVAKVIDGFEEVDIKTRFNGKPAILVQVSRTSKEDVIKIANVVKEYVKSMSKQLPEAVKLTTWIDFSFVVEDRIDLLLHNGIQGIVLVFIVLALFLNLRLAFWVSVGIPISFMVAFLILDSVGSTINMLSLFAFIMTLGILVDDAIIIGENIYTHFSKGKSSREAVLDGIEEVGGPVVMAVTTTIVVFVPLIFVGGIMGKFFSILPKTVIVILAASLFEAFIILPVHLDHALSSVRVLKRISWHEKLRRKVEKGLNFVIENLYTPAVEYVVKNRYFISSTGIAALVISIGVVAGGHVPFVLFPTTESSWIIAEVNYPLGTSFEVTKKTVEHLEQKAYTLNEVLKEKYEREKDIVINIYALIGQIARRDWKPGTSGGHCGEIWIELVASEKRPDISINEVLNKWRSLSGEMPGLKRLSFSILEGGPAGNPIEIHLKGDDFYMLQKAADELKAEIRTYPGTFDVMDNFMPGKPEKRVYIRDGAKSLGITMSDVAKQIRQAFYGEEALNIQRGRDDIKVMVRYDEADRRSIFGVEDMRIRTANCSEIPLEEVAELVSGKAYPTINRIDRKRVITVTSDIDESVANAKKIVADLNTNFLPKLVNKYHGLKCDLEGQEKRSKEALGSLRKGFLFALMFIFLLLASQFKSYFQPVVIMIAIPFGFVGAIAGHFIMGMPLSLFSIFGIVALSGIVVNDSLILIDFINRRARSGMEISNAVIKSGSSRFRPVILTSITTIAGLFPLLIERSLQAQFLVPMAVSITFGLFFCKHAHSSLCACFVYDSK